MELGSGRRVRVRRTVKHIFLAKQRADADYLIRALTDDEHRGMAARFIADIGAREGIPALERMLNVRDPDARRSAAIALGRLRADSAIPRLREVALSDEKPVTRAWAIRPGCHRRKRRACRDQPLFG